MEDRFIPALYVTLTEHNAKQRQLFAKTVSKFCVQLCFKTKSHLRIMRGVEYGYNLHEHIIVAVAEEELKLFRRKLVTLEDDNFKTIWNRKHFKIERFDMLRFKKCFDYVLVKHEPLAPYTLCPKHRAACRRGLCEVISTSRELVGSATALL